MLTSLRGIRVLDFTHILAGPFATQLLADLGAEVIKVERPGGGDDTRRIGPHFLGGESAYFLAVNRAKRSVVIDLAQPAGRAVVHALAAKSDVVIENFRAGVAARLGLDAATLHALNPALVVCGVSAFGQTGPDRDLPAFDLTLQARGGTMGLTGEPRRMPVRMGPPMGDLTGGLYAALGVCAGLVERARTGRGAVIDLALLDCQVSLLTYAASFYLNAGAVLGPQGSAHAHAIPYQAFATADRPITVAVFTERFWQGFCDALEQPGWADDPRFATAADRRAHASTLLEAITARLATRPAAHWLARLYEAGVPAAPVQSVDQVFADPQVLARGMVVETEHPSAGTVRTAGTPFRAAGAAPERAAPAGPSAPAPRYGEHTDAVLREVLGYDAARIAELRRAGALG